MAQPTLPLFVDVQNRQLVRSFTSTIPAILPVFYQGDTLTLVMRFMQATGVSSAPYTDIDYSAAAVTVGVGEVGGRPTAGSFSITDTSATQTTGELPYNATASQVQTAIQSALTTNWSKATVLGANGGPFTIINGTNGVQTALIGTSQTLTPSSSVPITTLQDGDSDLPAMQLVTLSLNPVALQNTWTASFSPDLLTGNLSLATSSLEEVMGNSPFICTTFSIQVIPVSGEPFTVYQNNFTIENDLIVGAPSIPTPGVSYYTTVESDARYARSQNYVERDSTGNSAIHVVTSGAGPNNILFLLSNNTSGTVDFTFDNGTFDGQEVTLHTTSTLSTVSYSGNVSVSGTTSIFAGSSLTFAWNQNGSVWFPVGN